MYSKQSSLRSIFQAEEDRTLIISKLSVEENIKQGTNSVFEKTNAFLGYS
jgi:hypothetical protein